VRVESCRLEFERQKKEFGDWFESCRKQDTKEQFATQLDSLESVLIRAHAKILQELPSPSTTLSIGDVYSRCQASEQRQLVLRRLWVYFRDKYDQRNDSVCGPVLAAADEIVWSCYAEIFRQAQKKDPAIERPTVPLPYVEPHYSPQATPRVDPPGDLRDGFFPDLLKQLPIPVVSIPPICISNPWWLVYLGHEVGHHVQFDLLAGSGLVFRFKGLLERSLREDSPPEIDDESVTRWLRTDLELFADVFSLLSMGAWSAWALGELALVSDMLKPVKRYPPGAVRLAFLAQLSKELGMTHVDILSGLDPGELASPGRNGEEDSAYKRVARTDLALVPKLAAGIARLELDGLGTLKELCGWSDNAFRPGGDVDDWSRGFRGKGHLAARKNIRGARLAISGAVAAWSAIAGIDDEDRRSAERSKLADKVLGIIPDCAEPGTRAAGETSTPVLEAVGDEVADALLRIDDGLFAQ
jgi:hypothetical protein